MAGIIFDMLFNSIEFLFFLPIVFLLYWFVFRERRLQNLFIVVASYVFYGWWDYRFLFLIILTSLFSYVNGLLIVYFQGCRSKQRLFSALNIILNLFILCTFKYYNFFVENIDILFSSLGYHFDWVTLNIILPVGISFYTFQALSYTIDVYRGNIRPTRDIIDFFAYICFFPQLVAGPIERATNLLPQFQKVRKFDYNKAVDGCRQMLWGLFKKMIIADACGAEVNQMWEGCAELSGLQLLILGILFTFQIYCDFSGYSDIAIGCARLFGFNLMRNFDNPYFSRSIPEFWRRWHISLTTWFRDYIYFPLGGSHCSRLKTMRNVFIVWGISGLWHGADWTFVCWGLYHATLLSIYNICGINTKYQYVAGHNHLFPNIKETIQIFVTFILAVFGWILFRAENLTQAAEFFNALVTNPFYDGTKIGGKKCIIGGFLLLAAEWIQREKSHGLAKVTPIRWLNWTFYILLSVIFIILLVTSDNTDFIYFQF